MHVDITLKNYRCFPSSRPVRIAVKPGFSAFVGVNNAGKSSLLRFFCEFRYLFQRLSSATSNLDRLLTGEAEKMVLPSFVVSDVEELFSDTNDGDLEMRLDFFPSDGRPGSEIGSRPIRIGVVVSRADSRQASVQQSHVAYSYRLKLGVENPDGKAITVQHDGTLRQGDTPLTDFTPVLQACQALASTMYIGSFRNALGLGGDTQPPAPFTRPTNYFDIHVGQELIRTWRVWKTGPKKRDRERAARVTEDIARIFQLAGLEINASHDDATLQLTIGGKSYGMHEVGSGLAQFFVVLANAAMAQPAYILIDEPELSLHPALQLDFLTTLASYASVGILFATHNLGLARASAERIYTVRRYGPGQSEVRPYEATPRLAEFLGELGFSSSRDLGFDTVLLVEGPSDVKAIQQFLRKYGLGHRVVLLPMGGASLINDTSDVQLEEIKRIAPRVFALIDSERKAEGEPLDPARIAFLERCVAAGVEGHALTRRALENYFSERAVQRVHGERYRALQPYERLKDAECGWPKAENWRIAQEMTREELAGTDLREFLASLTEKGSSTPAGARHGPQP